MIKKSIAGKIFLISWIFFLIYNIPEWNLPISYNFDLIPSIHITGNVFFKFITLTGFALLIFPFQAFGLIYKDKMFFSVIALILLVILIFFFSSALSDNPSRALSITIRYLYFLVVFYIALTGLKYFEFKEILFIKSFVYANVIIILFSLMDFYFPDIHFFLIKYFNRQEMIHSFVTINGEKVMRPMGILTDSNLTAFSVSISLMLILYNNDKFNKYFRISFYIAGSFVSGMLISRASFLMCILLVSAYFFIKKDKKEVIIFIFIFIIFQLPTPQTFSRIESMLNKSKVQEEFSVGRPVIWEASLNVFKRNAFIGAGAGMFFEKSDKEIKEILEKNGQINISDSLLGGFHKIDKLNPHNIFLVVLSESGLAGFFVFIILIILTSMYLIRIKNYSSLLFFIAVLFVSSFSNFAPYYKFYLIIIIILGLIFVKKEP